MPYLNSLNPKECGEIVLDKKISKIWNILIKPDKTALKEIKKKNIKFDLIHYDSDKSIDGRNYSYPILWQMLRKKGFFISDDIQDNMSFFKFCKKNDLNFDVIKYKNKFQGVIIK